MRSPLHIPASTHGHLAVTDLEKSLVTHSGDYEFCTCTVLNRLAGRRANCCAASVPLLGKRGHRNGCQNCETDNGGD
jgi:hypothetical protein